MSSADRRSHTGSPLKVFLAMTRVEPDWRAITVDQGDVRLGGFVVGGDPERMGCVNLHPAAEVHLPLDALHGQLLEDPPPWLFPRLCDLRRVRAEIATDYLSRLRSEPDTVEHEAVDWTDELGQAKSMDDEKGPAATLFTELLRHLVDPWLTRVVRSTSTGSLWAFGIDAAGDLVVGSYDVETRRAGEAPTFLWIPRDGRTALASFLATGLEASSFP